MELLKWLSNNWETIVVVIVGIAAVIVFITRFLKLTPKQQLARVQLALLDLVTEAERTLGTKTGKVKRAAVYSAVVKKFPVLSVFISEATYDKILDGTLEQFRTLLETNDALYEYVYNKKRTDESTEEIAKTYESLLGGNAGSSILAEAVESLKIQEGK